MGGSHACLVVLTNRITYRVSGHRWPTISLKPCWDRNQMTGVRRQSFQSMLLLGGVSLLTFKSRYLGCSDNNMHYCDVIMGAMSSQITSLMSVYSAVYSGAGRRKYQSSASLAFVRGIHRSPVNSPHKGPVTRKMFPFDDVIMGRPGTGVG